MDRLTDEQRAALAADAAEPTNPEEELDTLLGTATDIEALIIQAAVPLKDAIAAFDGDAFSRRLYEKLGISMSKVEAAESGLDEA